MPLLGISSILLHLHTCIKIKELIRCHLHYFPKKEVIRVQSNPLLMCKGFSILFESDVALLIREQLSFLLQLSLLFAPRPETDARLTEDVRSYSEMGLFIRRFFSCYIRLR